MRLTILPYVLLSVLILPAVILPAAASAQLGLTPHAVDDLVWMPPAQESVTITHDFLKGNDSNTGSTTLVLEQVAVHGTVVLQGNTFVYTPSPSFWSLGSDSFSYGLEPLSGDTGSNSTATVRIFRESPQTLVIAEDFEGNEPSNYSEVEGVGATVDVTTAAALLGNFGLEVTVESGSTAAAGLRFTLGDTTDGGATVLLGGGLNQGDGRSDFLDVAIWMVGPDSDDPDLAEARVVLSESAAGVSEIRIEVRDKTVTPNVFVSSPRLEVTQDLNYLNVEWWQSGGMLDLNGETVRVSGIQNPPIPTSSFGQSGIFPIVGTISNDVTLDFDGIEIRKYAQHPVFPLIAGDGFESADLSAWSHVNESQLAIDVTPLAITGRHSMTADLNVGSACLVQTDPDAEWEMSARVRFDVSKLLLDVGSVDVIDFLLFGTSGADVKLQLSEPFGQPLLAAVVAKNGGWAELSWYSLSAEHVVEVQMLHAPATRPNTGYLRLWIDGVAVGEVYGTDSGVTEWACLGAKDVGSTSGGELKFDDVDLWR